MSDPVPAPVEARWQDAARAALRYDDGARRLLLPFKHADRTDFASPLAGMQE